MKEIKISIDKVGTNYSTNAEEIFGYNYDSVNGNENGKYSVNDTTVIYYYTKNIKTFKCFLKYFQNREILRI